MTDQLSDRYGRGSKCAMVSENPQQAAMFGAAWAAGHLTQATWAGLGAVTMVAPAGSLGVVDGANQRPVFHLTRGHSGVAGAAMVRAGSSDQPTLLAPADETGGRRLLGLAKLTARPQQLRMAGIRAAELEVLDAGGGGVPAERYLPVGGLLTLGAYAVARLAD